MQDRQTRQEADTDRTVVLLKPDAVERGLVGTILSRLETAGVTLHSIESVRPSRQLVQQHYREHRAEPFFDNLVEYLTGEHVVAVDVRAPDAVTIVRDMVGDTEPAKAAEGTIRGDFGDDSFKQADAEERAVRNLVHASDKVAAAEREAELWF